jgi:hypothetical protein
MDLTRFALLAQSSIQYRNKGVGTNKPSTPPPRPTSPFQPKSTSEGTEKEYVKAGLA